ncbi:hypothetical protein PVAND_007461 [Polypedilum vanderplanki]|uniref:Uncharacterized protein n=1 Tax=Polypedilum vanderplanki TaxID=319348 RepID=A0A9J6C6R7_POLVA|nr:hypothetical protein PVAND_007461 [Polypedilum vanderplanki]
MINPIGGINSVKLTGYIEMTEDYNGDLHATIDANKCDFEMKNCLKYNLLKIENLCSIFTNKIGMFSMAFNSIKPPLKCPLKVGNHTLMDTQLDLTIFSVIPLDGAVWVANFKLIGTNGKIKKNGIFTDILNKIQPKLKCPIKVENYSFNNADFDTKVFSMMPIDNSRIARQIIPLKYENCPPDNLSMRLIVRGSGGIESLNFTGYFSVINDITGDIYVAIDSTRCDLERNNCDKLDTFILKNFCYILVKKNGIFTEIFSKIQPRLKCPLKIGNYSFNNAAFDTKVFSMMPIDGSFWIINIRLIVETKKSKKPILCLNVEGKVVKIRV